jgi:hypothetical protein
MQAEYDRDQANRMPREAAGHVILPVIPPGVTRLVRSVLAGRPPDLACKDSTRESPLDGWPLSCKQQPLAEWALLGNVM